MDTYLHVRLGVRRDKYREFLGNAKAFLETSFLEEKKGWKFLLGFEILSSRLVNDATRTPYSFSNHLAYFTNVWKLPPDADVASVMLELSELSEYVALDSLVSTETQEIVLRINDPLQSDEALAQDLYSGGLYAMVRHYPFRKALAQFVFSSASIAPQLAVAMSSSEEGKGNVFQYAGCYQNVTGLLNEFWDIWRVGDGAPSLEDEASKAEALVRTKVTLEAAIRSLNDPIAKDYKESIYFDTSSVGIKEPDGADDGIVVVRAAPYWKP